MGGGAGPGCTNLEPWVPPAAGPAGGPPSAPRPEATITRKTVLVADDEPDHRNIVCTLLRHYGYDVLEARTGVEAVEMVAARQPDMVLMDAGLPLLDGWAATTQLKRDPATAKIPIVMVTVHTQEGDVLRSAEAGADTYIAKPCTPSTVVAEVERWIGAA